ncbi:RDD family protein [Lysobacter antibioticus]|uniref:RDD family protein n=1 Tax=Lysobacter antibioticus TaxID=84531 RepID=UPI0003453AB8|nr:RDD family protein [Lysobacter antibioticus]
MDPQNPYQSPQSSLTEPAYGEEELAGRGIRLVAAIIDGVIMLVLLLPLMFVGGYFEQAMTAAQNGQQTFGLQFLWGLIGVILFFVIQAYPLNQSGQTWGKKVMKIKIVDMDGLQPSLVELLGKRYLFSQGVGLIPCLGAIVQLVDVLMIFRDDRRCLHDQIAGTKVVVAR